MVVPGVGGEDRRMGTLRGGGVRVVWIVRRLSSISVGTAKETGEYKGRRWNDEQCAHHVVQAQGELFEQTSRFWCMMLNVTRHHFQDYGNWACILGTEK